MDDEIIVTEEQEEIYVEENIEDYEVQEEVENITAIETVDVIQTLEEPPMVVAFNDAVAPLDEIRNQNLHGNLNGRYEPQQHSIEAITNLREELNAIKELQHIPSSGDNVAQYYMWADGNSSNEDRCGYFVSFVQDTNHIVKSDSDVIGVTVSSDEAGFIGNAVTGGIGNEISSTRGSSYGLVCMSGLVPVRALSTVDAGDKIVPDIGGLAKKSDNDYGYNVVSINDVNGIRYAMICLVPQTTNLADLQDDIAEVERQLEINQVNTTDAINAANEALRLQLEEDIEEVSAQASSAIQLANDATEAAESASEAAANVANTAGAIAQSMLADTNNSIESLRQSINSDIADMQGDITDLTTQFEPISTWTDGNGSGAQYLINHINNGLATKTEIDTLSNIVGDAFTAMSRNAQGTESMVSQLNNYFIGEHSPSYGLSFTEAQTILRSGIIYVPTITITESTLPSGTEDQGERFTFVRGNSYIWAKPQNSDDYTWVEECVEKVAFSSSYIIGGESIYYWFVDGDDDIVNNDITYPAGSLYEWIDGAWALVADIKSANSSWITSRIYQTASALGGEIATANGDIVALGGRIDDLESSITAVATNGDTIALMKAVANGESVEINSAALYNGAALINIVDCGTPSGDFYQVEPTWNNGWNFTGSYSTTPVTPCWTTFPDSNLKYYKYTCDKYNQWTRYTYEYIESFSGIKQQVDAAESSLAMIVSRGVDNTASVSGQTLSGSYYTTLPTWNGSSWVFSGEAASTTNNPPYYKAGSGSTYYKYDNPVTESGTTTWTRTTYNNTVNAASIVSAVNTSGSSVVINADHISLAGKTINLTSDNIAIDSTYFQVTKNGAITAKSGKIANWTIGENALYTDSNALYLGTSGITATIGGTSRSNLVFKAGSNFGVDSSGNLYASSGIFKGDIKINAGNTHSGERSLTKIIDDLYDTIDELDDKIDSSYSSIIDNNSVLSLSYSDYTGGIKTYIGSTTYQGVESSTFGFAMDVTNGGQVAVSNAGASISFGNYKLYVVDSGCFVKNSSSGTVVNLFDNSSSGSTTAVFG